MGGFLSELSKGLADRWVSLVVLPGALYMAVIAAALALGQGHALDAPYLVSSITALARDPVATTAAGQVVVLAAVLGGAAAAGLAAQALGSAAEYLALAAGWRTWRRPLRSLAGKLTASRRARWDAAHYRYHQLRDQAEEARRDAGKRLEPGARHAAYRTRARISPEQPDRPTWCGDRINAAGVRVSRDLNISLPDLWPYLWLHMPDQARGEITAARNGLTRAVTLAGWALLYAPLTGWWWPACIITAVLALTAWRRTRATAGTYADLIEAAARLYLTTLAAQLGLAPGDLPPPALGATITHQRLPTPPPGPPPAGPPAAPPPAGQSHAATPGN